MKLKIVFIFICIVFSSGCAGLQYERVCMDNILYSPFSPKIEVTMNSGMEFIGQKVKTGPGASRESGFASLSTKCSDYIFGKKEQDHSLSKGVIINLNELPRQKRYKWQASSLVELPDQLDSGVETLNGVRYDYGVAGPVGILSSRWISIVESAGYSFPEQAIVKLWSGKVNNKTMSSFLYFEDARDASAYGISGFINREFLAEFMKRSRRAFHIRDYTGVPVPSPPT